MVSLSTASCVLRAVEHARDVTLGSYLLPHGAIRNALDEAARRGAAVRVRLDASPYGPGKRGIVQFNKQAVKELRKNGVDAKLVPHAESGLHVKAVVCDGVAFLDDRNFPENGSQTVVRDDARTDVQRIRNSLLYDRLESGRFMTMEKTTGLHQEAQLIRSAHRGDTVEVQSEFFGATPVSSALHAAAQRGVHCKLQVGARQKISPREHAILSGLAAGGVSVRLGKSAEKFAVLNDTFGWVGSADATFAPKPQRDWSVRTHDVAITHSLHRTFAREWRAAKPLI